MKITRLKGNLLFDTRIEMDTFVRSLCMQQAPRAIQDLRMMLPYLLSDSTPADAERIPAVIFSSLYKQSEWQKYTGLILLEFNRLSSYEEACLLRTRICRYKSPYLAFIGSSGLSVKVLVRYTLPDGTLPVKKEDAERFHAHAYIRTVLNYQDQFNRKVSLRDPRLDKACRISWDPGCFYNPDVEPLLLEQPLDMPEKIDQVKIEKETSDPLAHILPGMEQMSKMNMLFETTLSRIWSEVGKTWEEDDPKSFLQILAKYCCLSGIPEENSVRWAFRAVDREEDINVVRQTFRNVYKKAELFASRPVVPASMNLISQMEEFLNRRYEFRFNELKNEVEYREKQALFYRFKTVTPEIQNGICLDAHEEGINIWDKDLKRYLYSPRIEKYNPLTDFIVRLPVWDGKDYIRSLADRVPTSDPKWPNRFYIWFLSMVAHWIKPGGLYANNLVPILTGGQGISKSTFFRLVLPPELQEYYVETINLENKTDAELTMSQNLLINIDEFDRLSAKYQADLKHLIQKPVLKIRKPHQRNFQIVRRYASFCATANPSTLLTDPTGSRRYICIEVKDTIPVDEPISYNQLYAQAVQAIRSGEKYWMNREEEIQLTQSNQEFQNLPLELQYVFTYFRLPEPGEKAKEYSAVELLDIISKLSGRKFSNTSAYNFSSWLKSAGIPKKHTQKGNVFLLIPLAHR